MKTFDIPNEWPKRLMLEERMDQRLCPLGFSKTEPTYVPHVEYKKSVLRSVVFVSLEVYLGRDRNLACLPKDYFEDPPITLSMVANWMHEKCILRLVLADKIRSSYFLNQDSLLGASLELFLLGVSSTEMPDLIKLHQKTDLCSHTGYYSLELGSLVEVTDLEV